MSATPVPAVTASGEIACLMWDHAEAKLRADELDRAIKATELWFVQRAGDAAILAPTKLKRIRYRRGQPTGSFTPGSMRAFTVRGQRVTGYDHMQRTHPDVYAQVVSRGERKPCDARFRWDDGRWRALIQPEEVPAYTRRFDRTDAAAVIAWFDRTTEQRTAANAAVKSTKRTLAGLVGEDLDRRGSQRLVYRLPDVGAQAALPAVLGSVGGEGNRRCDWSLLREIAPQLLDLYHVPGRQRMTSPRVVIEDLAPDLLD